MLFPEVRTHDRACGGGNNMDGYHDILLFLFLFLISNSYSHKALLIGKGKATQTEALDALAFEGGERKEKEAIRSVYLEGSFGNPSRESLCMRTFKSHDLVYPDWSLRPL